MNDVQLSALLQELLALSRETEWVEFKHNNSNPEEIAQYISALANSAALCSRNCAYLVWGIKNETLNPVGTSFKPRHAKKGAEELENWLLRSVHPQVNFKIFEFDYEGVPIVLFEIPRASHAPVRFGTEEFVRIGSLTKKLKDYPTKESELWASFSRNPFESSIAKQDMAADEVLSHIDFAKCFDLLRIPLPTRQSSILAKLAEEKLVVARAGGRFDIANLGAMLFAKNLNQFDRLARKSLRIIKYRGLSRTESEREWRDPPSQQGYALAFQPAVAFINSQLPQNEPIGQAFRSEVRMYPERAIRELVANALIHQDFTATGTGPMVEMFSDRMEITNPGEPLVATLRFIDAPPRSRNEALAATMRRMGICEEGGSGIDKVIESVELFQLPAPDFTTPTAFTKATLFSYKQLTDMDSDDRIRACYQHACLCFVSGLKMTNSSLRMRFGIEEQNAARASRIISETVDSELIKPFTTETSKRYMKYVPFWA